MPIAKHKIQYDPSDNNVHDRIGAAVLGLRGGNTQPIDSRDNSGTEELHVTDTDAIAELNAIEALLTTIDADTGSILLEIQSITHDEDSAHGSGDAGVMPLAVRNDTQGSLVDTDGDYAPLQVDSEGRLRTNADLDLDNLVPDDGVPGDEDPLQVGGIAHDASAVLGTLSADGDKFHMLGDLYRRQYINDAANVAIKATNQSIDTTTPAVELASTPLAGRTKMVIQNRGTAKSIFIGEANTVTNTTGFEIPKFSTAEFPFGEAINVYAIADSGSTGEDVRILEMG